MQSDHVLTTYYALSACMPITQCRYVTVYWFVHTDFVDIVRWSCSSSVIMPPK